MILHHFSKPNEVHMGKPKLNFNSPVLVPAPKGGAGFTLTEALVIIALLLVVIVMGSGIFIDNNIFYENQTGKIALINATRLAADLISEYGREAVAFESAYTYSGVDYTTSASTVIFRLPGRNASGDIIAGIYDVAIVAADPADPSRLELIVDADPGSVRPERRLLMTDRLTTLAFAYDNVDVTVAGQMSFEITATAGGRHPATETVSGQVTLRN